MAETTTAAESQIEATHRLCAEGRWAEASLFKDEMIAELRGQGIKRAEAGEQT